MAKEPLMIAANFFLLLSIWNWTVHGFFPELCSDFSYFSSLTFGFIVNPVRTITFIRVTNRCWVTVTFPLSAWSYCLCPTGRTTWSFFPVFTLIEIFKPPSSEAMWSRGRIAWTFEFPLVLFLLDHTENVHVIRLVRGSKKNTWPEGLTQPSVLRV